MAASRRLGDNPAMSLAAVLALGFFLGMRHATDADHVVAVSTIVSRQRTLRAAAPIGMLWGVGHTLTILLVGGAILLFGIVIPPRLGLGMELSVALMLVLLGALNVRSVLRVSELSLGTLPIGSSPQPLLTASTRTVSMCTSATPRALTSTPNSRGAAGRSGERAGYGRYL